MARLNVTLFGLDGSQARLVLLQAEQTLERAARVAALRSMMTGVASPVLEAITDVRSEIEAATGGPIALPWEEEH